VLRFPQQSYQPYDAAEEKDIVLGVVADAKGNLGKLFFARYRTGHAG